MEKKFDDLKIEKGIPIPSQGKNGGSAFAIVLRQMEIGDSVFFAKMKTNDISGRLVTLRPLKFTQRTVAGGVRVWRIA